MNGATFWGEQLRVGRSIGFDYEVIDKDKGEEGFPSVLGLSPGGGKAFNTSNVSDLVLVDPKAKSGTLSGKIGWKESSDIPLPNTIRLNSTDNPLLQLTIKVAEDGSYEANLPQGNYQISPPYAIRYSNESMKFAVMDRKQSLQLSHHASTTVAPDFLLRTLSFPDVIPSKGRLHELKEKEVQQVDAFMKDMMDYFQVPGASLALIKDGKEIHHQTYGYQNALTKEPVNEQTLFEAASITKAVFAFVVNRLVERGEFDLNKPLHQYLPFEEVVEDERYQLMTGYHVLTHTSGLPNWGRYMQESPGTKYGYSGEGFEYLKRAVVHETGRDIEELVATEFLQPLEISNTHFSKNGALVKVAAHGHFETQPTIFDIPTEAGMAHSMYTNAHNFSPFLIALLERKGLQASTYDNMLQPQTKTPSSPYEEALNWKESFGLGIVTAETPYGKMYGHGGNNGDFRCQFEVFDEGKIGYALFTNGSNGHLLVRALREFLITGKVTIE